MAAETVGYTYCESPVGRLLLAGRGGAVETIAFPAGSRARGTEAGWRRDDAMFGEARAQLLAYFDRRLTRFTFAIRPIGTPFQRAVWAALGNIPYGRTVSYGDLAAIIGRPGAVRAVGAANGANPLPIVLPCHRVVGADGALTGYGGGLAAKRFLLALEGALPPGAVEPDLFA